VVVPQIAGTAAQVADALEDLFRDEACDGFMVSPAHLPHGFDHFVQQVIPELQQRGLFRTHYHGSTLRENLRDA
jgi:alkanesulfonate monooxygenase SsuD/methylene tetrahydromethanopterin reductase-like flavin-dependent oxidoreductase (luciferase family)